METLFKNTKSPSRPRDSVYSESMIERGIGTNALLTKLSERKKTARNNLYLFIDEAVSRTKINMKLL